MFSEHSRCAFLFFFVKWFSLWVGDYANIFSDSDGGWKESMRDVTVGAKLACGALVLDQQNTFLVD